MTVFHPFRTGAGKIRSRSIPKVAQTSTIVGELFKGYRVEGLRMPYTMQDFLRDVAREHVHELTAEERMAGLSSEEILAGLGPEQIEAFVQRLQGNQARTRKKPVKRHR
jgi:hypothetical protein